MLVAGGHTFGNDILYPQVSHSSRNYQGICKVQKTMNELGLAKFTARVLDDIVTFVPSSKVHSKVFSCLSSAQSKTPKMQSCLECVDEEDTLEVTIYLSTK